MTIRRVLGAWAISFGLLAPAWAAEGAMPGALSHLSPDTIAILATVGLLSRVVDKLISWSPVVRVQLVQPSSEPSCDPSPASSSSSPSSPLPR